MTDQSVSTAPEDVHCVTIRFPGGRAEHRYGTRPPKVGDKIRQNGDEHFVTNVETAGDGVVVVTVGTRVPAHVRWEDAVGHPETSDETSARERLLEAAYELFSQRGVRAVGTEELLQQAGVARATFYRHFRSKDELARAFLHRREHRWTREFVEAEARRRGETPREQLLAIFDVFDEWFRTEGFDGCSFINVLLETADLQQPLGRATAEHLENIRSIICQLAEECGLDEPTAREFAHSWHILMKGSIVAAGEGDVHAATRAKPMGEALLDRFLAENPSRGDLSDAV